MNNLLSFFVAILFFSCNSKDSLEQIFITAPNEFWRYEDSCQSHGVYFKFYKDGHYDKYISKPTGEGKGFQLFNNDGDLISDVRTWNVKNDSVFTWEGANYDVEKGNKQQIILHYKDGKKNDCSIIFTKIIDQ